MHAIRQVLCVQSIYVTHSSHLTVFRFAFNPPPPCCDSPRQKFPAKLQKENCKIRVLFNSIAARPDFVDAKRQLRVWSFACRSVGRSVMLCWVYVVAWCYLNEVDKCEMIAAVKFLINGCFIIISVLAALYYHPENGRPHYCVNLQKRERESSKEALVIR